MTHMSDFHRPLLLIGSLSRTKTTGLTELYGPRSTSLPTKMHIPIFTCPI